MKFNVIKGIISAGLILTMSAMAKVDFSKDIAPILKDRCLRCHRAPYKDAKSGRLKKPKAGLRVDTPALLMKGSEDGKVIIPGKSSKSSFYKLTALPKDHDDIMPSKGDLLTLKQQTLLKNWIDEGASFGSWKGFKAGETGISNVNAPHLDPLDILAKGVKPASSGNISKVIASGATVLAVSQKNNLLCVNFRNSGKTVTDSKIITIGALSDNLTILSLASTAITDSGLEVLAKCKMLTSLHLENTTITDAGLKYLVKLQHLQYLNLYNTKVTDAGLSSLKGLKNLKRLYLWQTKVTPAGVTSIKKALPGLYVNTGSNLKAVKVSEILIPAHIIKVAGFFDKGSCCHKAHAKKQVCAHACCVKSFAAKKVCLKCNPGAKGKIK